MDELAWADTQREIGNIDHIFILMGASAGAQRALR